VAGVRDVEAARAALGKRERLHLLRLDVTDPDQVERGVREAERIAGGALACVVNNAGYAVLGAQEDADLEEVRAMLETNLLGAARVTQAALPAMRERRCGTVVYVSSIGARMPIPLLGFYQASKAAMSMLAEALAVECRPFGVRVALIEPGVVRSDFPLSVRPTGAAPAGRGPYRDLLPAVRAGIRRLREDFPTEPTDVAAAVVAAATAEEWPLRTILGGDAELIERERSRGSDEGFQDALVRLLGLDWPRSGARR
jgi:NAD(P)-dependent dehydrogenase (short-subunit alcohol dehydrogenase family)